MSSKRIYSIFTSNNNRIAHKSAAIKYHVKTHFDDEPIEMEFFNVRRTEERLVGHQCLNKRNRSFLFGISDDWEGPYEMQSFSSRMKIKERNKP